MAYRTVPFRNSSRISKEDIADFYEERDELKESEEQEAIVTKDDLSTKISTSKQEFHVQDS